MKIKSLFLLILPAILIAGLVFSGMSTWDDEGYSVLGEEVQEVLEETLEEACCCDFTQAVRLFAFLFEKDLRTDQQGLDVLCFSADGGFFICLPNWMVPLRI